jgi:hypothetical protein
MTKQPTSVTVIPSDALFESHAQIVKELSIEIYHLARQTLEWLEEGKIELVGDAFAGQEKFNIELLENIESISEVNSFLWSCKYLRRSLAELWKLRTTRNLLTTTLDALLWEICVLFYDWKDQLTTDTIEITISRLSDQLQSCPQKNRGKYLESLSRLLE